MAESFAYRVVLNGIVLARSTQEAVFTDSMTYRAFAGQGLHDAPVFMVRAKVSRRRVCGGYIRRGLFAVGACHRWMSAGRGNAAQKILARLAGRDSADDAPGFDA